MHKPKDLESHGFSRGGAIKCPVCNTWTFVLYTRGGAINTTTRRRECANGHRFTTVETLKVKNAKAHACIPHLPEHVPDVP